MCVCMCMYVYVCVCAFPRACVRASRVLVHECVFVLALTVS